MAYVSTNYKDNPSAPFGQWVCTRTSKLGPYDTAPTDHAGTPDFCGQCVSFVTTVCPSIPVNTNRWKQGELVKGNLKVMSGTAIATFNKDGKYYGHAAIYESQNAAGLSVVDQWVAQPATAIHRRTLRFGAHGLANNGDNFYVVE
jgi:hypothetical protein